MQERFIWERCDDYKFYEFKNLEDIKEIYDLVLPFIKKDVYKYQNDKLFLENIDYLEIQATDNIVEGDFYVGFHYKDGTYTEYFVEYNMIKNYLDKHDLINYYPVKLILQKNIVLNSEFIYSNLDFLLRENYLIKNPKYVKVLAIFDQTTLNSKKLLEEKIEELKKLGFKKENITILDFDKITNFYNLDLDLIYVPKINVFEILKKIRETNFFNELKNYILNGVVYLGIDSGVHLVTQNVEHLSSLYNIKLDNYDALGILDSIIYLYDTYNEETKKEFLELKKKYESKYRVEEVSDRSSFYHVFDSINEKQVLNKNKPKLKIINRSNLEFNKDDDQEIIFKLFDTIYDIDYKLEIETKLKRDDFYKFLVGDRRDFFEYIKSIKLNANNQEFILEECDTKICMERYTKDRFFIALKFKIDIYIGNLEFGFYFYE